MINYKPLYTNSWALVIGINAYQSCSPLSYACNDADAVASVLVRGLGFEPGKLFLFGLMIQRAITPGTGRFVNDMLQRVSRQVITAGKADETVADGGGPHGQNSIFTGYLIDGLNGSANDANGVLTANMLMNFVYTKVGQDNRSQQTPHYGHIEGDGDFILRTPNNSHLSDENSNDYIVQTTQEVPEIPPILPSSVTRPSFAERIGYADPEHPNFGRNDLSARLGERTYRKGFWGADYSKAYSWLTLIVEPVATQALTINLTNWLDRVRPYFRTDANSIDQFHLFRKTKTTIDSIVLYNEIGDNLEFWANYFRLSKAGNIEYADSTFSFWVNDDIRSFSNVQVIGLAWQVLFLAKAILSEAGFSGGVRLLFNLVGARETILSDFSTDAGENESKWSQPFSYAGELSVQGNLSNLQCQSPNLQMEYNLTLRDLTQENSFKIIEDIAQQLVLAYNHQTAPRCFNYNTESFPWKQYFSAIHNLGG